MSELAAVSPLGHPRERMGAILHQGAGIAISEAPFAHVLSVRQSRKAPEGAAQNFLKSLGGRIVRIEPRAWLVLLEYPLSGMVPDAALMVTELSDCFALFKLSGPWACDLIAAGSDPQLTPVGSAVRTRFGGIANVVIERRAQDEYLLAVDVSLAQVMGSWLAQAARRG